MIDIHAHLLYEVDDGAKNIEDSLRILRDLENLGYKEIVLTPHYIKDSNYNSTKIDNEKRLILLKEKLREEKININLFLGNEIFIDNDIIYLIKQGIVSSLNNSKYFLIELPMSGEFEGYEDILKEIIDMGYHVILAHPERYFSFQKNFDRIYSLEKMGILFQSNIESIIGSYGLGAKKLVRRLLKEKKITFLATDIHHRKKDYHIWDKAKKKMLKYIKEDEYNLMTDINPKKYIFNEDR